MFWTTSLYPAAGGKQVTELSLIGLDLCAAFDMVCHENYSVQCAAAAYGDQCAGTALSWMQSYLQGRTQFVKLGQHHG